MNRLICRSSLIVDWDWLENVHQSYGAVKTVKNQEEPNQTSITIIIALTAGFNSIGFFLLFTTSRLI